MTRFGLKRPATADEKKSWLERLKSKCAENERGCWIWQGFTNRLGYAKLSFQNQYWMAHRLMWVLTRSEIPKDMFVCHTCDMPSCCNPYHLFLGTHTQNQRDMIYKKRHAKGSKTHCMRGHEFTPENTLVTINECGGQRRSCKLCHRRRERISAGWPAELAESLDAVPHGHEPIGGRWPRKKKPDRNGANPDRE